MDMAVFLQKERNYHSGQNDYIHKFLFWAVISEYVKNSLTQINSSRLIFEYVKNSFTDKIVLGQNICKFLQILLIQVVCLYTHEFCTRPVFLAQQGQNSGKT